ncbi:endo-1,4-beta-xylanase [Pseudanabaena sp. 'Roaring Creek']|uniref:endo-1,4-beta-xylanase n=1 Tax=Pseudanabaena sp. 'Roaring Creek' TaxID=1681830 RepID=UPI0006D811D4|nr:endo-1,4-beta-xylanase [Pseudanabaena sp. 'Roaring Creek']
MKWNRRQFFRAISTLGISTVLSVIFGQKYSEAENWQATNEESDRRIQKLRTANLEIRLLDHAGQPIANQIVKIEHWRHLFNFGAAYHTNLNFKDNESTSDRLHREYFLQLFNAATVTFYWRYYEPQENQYADAALLQQIAWLKHHDFYLRGHPLFWNHNPACLPLWLENRELTSQEVRLYMDKVIQHMSEFIFPLLDEVDVFNELVTWDNYDHPFTDLFKEQGKINVVKEYLTKFKQLNPKTRAVINDFISNSRYPQILQEFQKAQVPFDSIGQQAHMFGRNWTIERLKTTIENLSSLGKPIVLTEVSVLSGATIPNLDFSRTYTDWQSDRDRELIQADYLELLYRLAYSYPHISGIFLWSYSDRGAWLGAPTGILNKDGIPKPAFTRLNRLINQTWRTNVELKTDSNGYAIIANAYEGIYKIVIGNQTFLNKHTSSQPLKKNIPINHSH